MSSLILIIMFIKTTIELNWDKIETDKYSNAGTYLVMEPPYDLITSIGSVVYLDYVGSYHIVHDGTAFYFQKGKLISSTHIQRGRYKYKKISRMPNINPEFHLLFNNCKQFRT